MYSLVATVNAESLTSGTINASRLPISDAVNSSSSLTVSSSKATKTAYDAAIVAQNMVTAISLPRGVIMMFNGATAPTGWAICDGQNGTPDLRDKFVVGAGSSYALGGVGGSATATLIEANLPPHTHTGTTSTIGNHVHDMPIFQTNDGNWAGCGPPGDSYNQLKNSSGNYIYVDTAGNGSHNHTFTTNSGKGTSTPFSIMPPYYALVYIMKL